MPKPKHAIIFGDIHCPYHDPAALQVLHEMIGLVQPDLLVCIGDTIDCPQLSRFDRDPRRREDLQEDIDTSVGVLNEILWVAPEHTVCYLLEGNHEERMRRAIWAMRDQARQLAQLRTFQQYITWPELLAEAGLHDRWQWIPYDQQPGQTILPNLLVKHGTKLANGMGASGRTAFKEWMTYGKGGLSGHTHRLGDFFHRDLTGTDRWVETGCLCLLDGVPGATGDNDWHQGLVVTTIFDDWYSHELVYIEDGRASWRDHKLTAKS